LSGVNIKNDLRKNKSRSQEEKPLTSRYKSTRHTITTPATPLDAPQADGGRRKPEKY
jgi:hypothetical protein